MNLQEGLLIVHVGGSQAVVHVPQVVLGMAVVALWRNIILIIMCGATN